METPKSFCPICNKEKKESHKYCSFSCRNISINSNRNYSDPTYRNNLRESLLKEPKILPIDNCKVCNTEFTVTYKGRKYCSRKCSNIGRYSDKGYREKISESISKGIKRKWEEEEYRRKMSNVSSISSRFTSKNEMIIRNFFIENFPEQQWTFGGSLKVEDERIVRDLYSKKMKICFEYDGIFHFKKIFKNYEKKKKKDLLLKKWCKDNDYKLIRMSDSYFNRSSNPIQEILDAINSEERIVFLYSENENEI